MVTFLKRVKSDFCHSEDNNRFYDLKFREIRDTVVTNTFCLKKTSKIKVGLKKMGKSYLLTFTSMLRF